MSLNQEGGVPQCVGIILDGNRRWAKERGIPSLMGHRKGFENLIEAARWVREAGVAHLAVYAFSTENWNRSSDEVTYLMELFKEMAGTHLATLGKEGVRIRFIGERARFSADLQALMREAEEGSALNTSFTVWVCLSYGGRAEILAAARRAQEDAVEISDESLRARMWSAEMPDPDLIIRTGGEMRLSGFLTWQSIYSELFFLKTYWPDFSRNDLDAVLSEYAQRQRRMGK